MIAAVDVQYHEGGAEAACVTFDTWASAAPLASYRVSLDTVAPYVPGEFYRRELPCLLAVLAQAASPVDVVVIDGYVWLSNSQRKGLGAHLHEALGGGPLVIGVAKTPFQGASSAVPVFRGTSSKPLYVTAAGTSPTEAAGWIAAMHGQHRIPTLLKRVDQLCRSPRTEK